jgi:sugar phosphate isomerase/epimerase
MEAGSNIGAVCDVWHWHHSGGTAQDILNCDKSRIVHIHMSDAPAMPAADVRDNMRLMPGEGIIDYVAFFGALKRIGYTGGVAPEPLGPRIPMDMTTEDAAKLGYDTTLAMMKKGGVA